jgi:hypothetical protein
MVVCVELSKYQKNVVFHLRFGWFGLWCLTPLSTIFNLQLPVQSVPITTKIVSSNPVHGEVYSIQHVSDLRQVNGFLWVLRFSPQIKYQPMYNKIPTNVQ